MNTMLILGVTGVSIGAVFGLFFYWRKKRKSKQQPSEPIVKGEDVAEYGLEVLEEDGKNMVTNPFPHLKIIGTYYLPVSKKGGGLKFPLTVGKEPFFLININGNLSQGTGLVFSKVIKNQSGDEANLILKIATLGKNSTVAGFTVIYGEY